ncbi:hypothetical protein COU20_01800 [Candidatus Kaiserbacteria bacterium CG10_big_fil_rev_8_21_14_0_10_59_10]|uniref:DNA-directed DNA polymerase n=1 Tax=Candidatus Kaiserbacteria bacterium CG10_big_fil_rev_8_21_14_0_10_59_10 TaxID=1974612 RepID=A0A2H0U7Y9_9BACT|nr:MAG: hypothetical protein COU20_01800 [Candidatus Kaiserbacteria bacterium CG10_big_fil_rev_8_21_14_0_10_59_10]
MAAKKTAASKHKGARVVLLDSHAIIHRAYHALPDFSSSKGAPTGALYGLLAMLLKTVSDLKPDYIIAARDLPGPTKRHALFEDYKATRVKADDALISQLERAPEVFDAFGIPLYEAPGYEADDVLATIVKQLSKRKDIEIIIATGDLDTLQLVEGKRVRVYTLRQGLSDTVLYDEDKVHERFGFAPAYIADYKGLRGDPSDNIKGIAGIGEKSASKLIQEFGSLEDIYAALKKDPEEFTKRGIKPRVVQLLAAGEKDARFSKGLALTHADAPVAFALPERAWNIAEHTGAIADICDELEFRSLKERVRAAAGLEGSAAAGAAAAEEVDPRALSETAIALWLIRSDITNPSLDDILRFAKTERFESARAEVFKTLRATGRLFEVFELIEKPLIPIVERMNADGIALDTKYLGGLKEEYAAELAVIAARIYAHAGREFNINSPRQLAEVLFDELKLVPPRARKTPTGARTTREEELSTMADQHPIIADVLSYRELSKLLSTYVEKMPALAKSGRLHAEFLQAGTTTGRMASQNPNLQNIPIRTEYGKRIRKAFAAEGGSVLIALDYSQIELRIAAGLSGDARLVDVFKKGQDIHAAVAAEVFRVPPEQVDYEMRRRAKVINFGILYGMGVNALRESLSEGAEGGVSRAEAGKYLSDYFSNFSGLARWIETTKRAAAQHGYTETLFGRRRYFSGFSSPLPPVVAQAERMAVNAPVQGTQSDIIKLAMVRADELIEKEGWRADVRLVLQVHDELVYEAAAEKAERAARAIKEVMETAVDARKLSGVPIVAQASVGPNWGELQRLEPRRV